MSRVKIEDRDFAFKNRLQTFSIVNITHTNLDNFFADAYEEFFMRVNNIVEELSMVVIGACFVGEYAKLSINDEDGDNNELGYSDVQTQYTQINTNLIDIETNLVEFFNESIVMAIKSRIEDGQFRGSGLALVNITELNIQISSFEPLAGSSYLPLPKSLHTKKAIINVQNLTDNMCFQYAVLSALFPVGKNASRPLKYESMIEQKVLNFNGIKFPVKIRDISKFEKQNPTISIHVYMWDSGEKSVRPIRLAKEIRQHHIHLLMITTYDDEEGGNDNNINEINKEQIRSHYCWINNLSALLSRQLSKNHNKKFLCDRCLNYFISDVALNEHFLQCVQQNECVIEMPTEENNKMQFDKRQNQLKVPFIIYADIESLLLKQPTIQPYKSGSTVAYQEHKAYSIGYYFKHLYDDSKSYYRSYRGEKCIDWFVLELQAIGFRVADVLNRPKAMRKTEDDESRFQAAKECHICGGAYTENDKTDANKQPVRDHSHITGEYRGSAHSICNLQYQEAKFVPVVFHNLSHYDAHFIVKKLALNIEGPVSIIPLNNEIYISFTKVLPNNVTKFEKYIKFRFIDSFRFLPSSLDYLVSLLPSDKKIITNSYLKNVKGFNNTQIALLQRKGTFCYDYVDDWSKLNEECLPSKDQFYSTLTDGNVSDVQYEHAKTVWNTFNIKTLGEYSDLYMQTDILLLADVFQNFRSTCYNIYGLDPAHYYTAPGLSFDAMLKYTKVEIELLTDIDMLLFIERGIRGGISQCSKRYVKANNRYMGERYDASKESNFLIYLDANNLYGHSMSQYLPLNNFRWCTFRFTEHTILQLHDQSCDGYIFEVDLEYPKSVHDLHSDYPMCAEKRSVPGCLSSKNQKLLLTLFDKEHYVLHYRMLKLALQQGLRLKRIHRVLQFDQRAWLKPYIDLNTEMRKRATNDFEKNFFKLMINTIFGKTMEDMRGRSIIKLKTKWEGRYGARKMVAQPNFKQWTGFGDDLVAIHMHNTVIKMSRPISVGMSVLELSKVLMYDFYYNFMKPKYGENVEMLYTDTDSFMLNVKTDSFYTDMVADIDERYDTSDYPLNNVYGIEQKNKKQPGFFKDELNGRLMTEFVGLRSKMYSFRCSDSNNVCSETKKAKGVTKNTVTKTIQFSDYVDCIENGTILVRTQNTIRSKRHCVYSIRQEKIALSPFDDKRYIHQNNIDTLPWGHYSILNEGKNK